MRHYAKINFQLQIQDQEILVCLSIGLRTGRRSVSHTEMFSTVETKYRASLREVSNSSASTQLNSLTARVLGTNDCLVYGDRAVLLRALQEPPSNNAFTRRIQSSVLQYYIHKFLSPVNMSPDARKGRSCR